MAARFVARSWFLALFATCLTAAVAVAQPAPRTAPPPGLRDSSPNVHAIVGAKIVVSPERTIDKGTIVIRDGVIVAVGEKVTPPADARVWSGEGKTLYPGFIDAYGEVAERGGGRRVAGGGRGAAGAAPAPSESGGARYWNANVVPETKVCETYSSDPATNRRLREQGITTRLVAPSAGVIKGASALVSTADDGGKLVILKEQVAMHLKLSPSRGTPGYPSSPMGALTLVRQAFYDAGWYGQAWDAYSLHPELPRPERVDSLEVLRGYLGRKAPVIIDAQDELYFMRADQIAKEFALNIIVRGSGEEYQRLDDIKATGRPVIVPLNFPRAPNVNTPEAAMNVSLERLMHWDLAPENPGRLDAAGVKIAFTSFGMRDRDPFLGAVRKAVRRGLKPEAALKALTTTPAEWYGASDRLGTLEAGKAANIVVTSGDLFNQRTRVLETWVDGNRHEIETEPPADLRGQWKVDLVKADGQSESVTIELTGQPRRLTGKITRGDKSTPLVTPAQNDLQFTATFKGEPIGYTGVVQLSATVSEPGPAVETKDAELTCLGTVVWPDGTYSALTGRRTSGPRREGDRPAVASANRGSESARSENASAEQKETPPQTTPPTPPPGAPATRDDQPPPANADETPAREREGRPGTEPRQAEGPTKALAEVNYPLGEFGRKALPEQPAAVLFKNATIWTSGPQGRLDKADLLVESGKIRQIGPSLVAREGATVIDLTGKHLAPGIIDCHSHIATDGGVNEGSQSITAEVRIADFINPNDINIYRQLAGGVTSSNILHGSANTIGGQNQVIKFRWGANAEEMKFATAPPGIKFALGENVKQSNSNNTQRAARYPATRMGVEQLVRDAFSSAKQYRDRWNEWNRTRQGVPPRVDLELEALAEVVEGKRIIHCHSYRQDEILALMRTCEEYGIKIGTFQHILEGYKVADVMAKHGVGGSSFADHWAYKLEAFDAIPYNGALLHNAGVLMSYNSDGAELARRLNLEAAKAVRYGHLSPEEALKFVTFNPAKQLGIHDHVGSLEVGKDADFVVWSGPPLSTHSRCEQTWVDGRRYFDLSDDQQNRRESASLHASLVQRILTSGEATAAPGEDQRETWPTHDEACEHGDDGEHHHDYE